MHFKEVFVVVVVVVHSIQNTMDDIDDVGDSDMMRWMDKGKANLSISFKATSTRAEYLPS